MLPTVQSLFELWSILDRLLILRRRLDLSYRCRGLGAFIGSPILNLRLATVSGSINRFYLSQARPKRSTIGADLLLIPVIIGTPQ